MTPIEIEHKFLIKMPSITALESQSGYRIRKMSQTYLACEQGKSERVRKIEENGVTSYVHTVKERISVLSCYEEEKTISEIEYNSLLLRADRDKKSISKTRYSFEYASHTLEIDVYDFWNDRATLEIELSSEDEPYGIPDFIEVIKEVSDDKRYKNTNLAKSVPFDEI